MSSADIMTGLRWKRPRVGVRAEPHAERSVLVLEQLDRGHVVLALDEHLLDDLAPAPRKAERARELACWCHVAAPDCSSAPSLARERTPPTAGCAPVDSGFPRHGQDRMALGIVIELDTGALLLYGIPFIIVVGWFSSRLLGVHRGWGRSLVAGFFGWVVGVAVAAVIEDQNIRTTRATRGRAAPGVVLRRADLDVRRADPRRHPEAEAGQEAPLGRPCCTRSRR